MRVIKKIFGGIIFALGCLIYLKTYDKTFASFLYAAIISSAIFFELDIFSVKTCTLATMCTIITTLILNIIPIIIFANITYWLSPDILEEAQAFSSIEYAKNDLQLVLNGFIYSIIFGIGYSLWIKSKCIWFITLSLFTSALCGFQDVLTYAFYLRTDLIPTFEYLKMLYLIAIGNFIGGSVFVFIEIAKMDKEDINKWFSTNIMKK